MDIEDIDVFIAPASARSEHWATAPTRAGRKALDKALPDDEARPRTLYDKPADTTKPADHGSPLVVVDQPATTRGTGSGGGPGHGHHHGLPARTVDAPHRRPGTGQRQDRCEGRSRHRRRRPHHAPHPARHQHLGGGHRGAEHALTSFDPDPARQVNQSEGRIRASSPPHDPQRGAAAGERGRGPVVKPSPRPATNDGTIRSRSTHRIGPRRRMPSHAPFSMRPENRPAPGDSHDWSRFRRLPGAAYRTRTDDLLFTRQLLYQLS